MRFITSVISICVLAVIIVLIVFTPEPCEHSDTLKIYSFQYEKSTAAHSTREYCNICGRYTTTYSARFRGTPTDQSYLEAIVAQSDASEIIPGEYCTITATVTSAGVSSYDEGRFWTVRVGCKIENSDFEIYFSADFRKEFWDQVDAIEKDDIVIFRGRFYAEGCGFTDCELIDVKKGT